MLRAQVVGTATATVKHASLQGWKLLVVQPMAADGTTPDGDPLLVVDPLGAGRGQWVMLTSDGAYVRELLRDRTTPMRWSVIGIEDTCP